MIGNKNILVTGGAGAIGVNLVQGLLDKKAKKIIVVDDLSSGHKEFLPKNSAVQLIESSVVHDELYKQLEKEKIDVIYHLAALFANQKSVEQPLDDLNINGLGILKMLEFARKKEVQRFVYSSSSCVYGGHAYDAEEEALPHHLMTPYAITKLLGEHYAHFYYKFHNVPTVTLRCFNSFGPGELPGKYRNVIPNFIQLARKQQPLTITGDGNETRDFNWVGNIIQSFILAAEKDEAIGETFNIGAGHEIKIREVAELVNKITGNTKGIIFKERRAWDDVLRRKANISKATKILGYTPEIDFERHLKATYDWHRSYVT